MRRKSEKTKRKLKMGEGDGKNYKPYIEVGEFGSMGTAVCLSDYKNGRRVHLLSQAEMYVWYLLRWEDEVIDIKEQFPLPLEETLAIAKKYGLRHPRSKKEYKRITSDFYVITKLGDFVVSVKTSKDMNRMNLKNMFIEKKYWNERNIKWILLTTDNVNKAKAMNIFDVTRNYSENYFPDKINFVKYLIGHKLIEVDMDKHLNYQEIMKEHEREIEKWQTALLELENTTK